MTSNSYIFTTSITGVLGANTAAEINETNRKIQSWWAEQQDFADMSTPMIKVPSNQKTVKGE